MIKLTDTLSPANTGSMRDYPVTRLIICFLLVHGPTHPFYLQKKDHRTHMRDFQPI